MIEVGVAYQVRAKIVHALTEPYEKTFMCKYSHYAYSAPVVDTIDVVGRRETHPVEALQRAEWDESTQLYKIHITPFM